MPYKSEAQRGYMHAAAARGDVPKKVVREFDQASAGMKGLPMYVKSERKEYAYGGMVEDICPHCGSNMDGPSLEQEEEYGDKTEGTPTQERMDDYQRKKALFQQSFRGR